ncbi:MAG: Uma2 family endonuclease [Acidobacteria bacterium]|nr:Uma2 family endonuclease [Acidobacteriota bacterium]
MRAAALTSVQEYLTTSYRPDCEYIEGVLLERNLGEYEHSRLQMLLIMYFGSREKQWGIRVVPEQRVQVKPNRFRVPDVRVVKADAPIEPIFTRPPFLCVEILSKDDRMGEMQERIDDYLAFGVPTVWLLDPRTKRAYVFTPGEMHEVKDGILRSSDLAITVPLAALFD